MADKTDLERAVDEMISDLDRVNSYTGPMINYPMGDEDAQYWRSEYWIIKDEYDQLVDQIETLVRKYCNG